MWWYFNRDRYLQLGRFLAGLNTSSGEGGTSALPSKSQVENQIMPALERVLRSGGKVEVMRGAMLSIAGIEAEYGPLGMGLDHYALHYLKNGAPENKESALVALGIRGDAKSVELLRSILLDGERGREAMGGSVGVRNRAYAAYAMGLIGAKTPDEATRLRVVDTLLIAIGADHSTTRETQVACALSVGLVPLPFCGDDPERLARHAEEGDLHLCGGVQLNYLLQVFQDRELDVWLRSHTAPAMGRLAARAPNEYKQAISESFFAALDPRQKLEREVVEGAVIGLGLMGDGDQDEVDQAIRSRLSKLTKKGEPLMTRFATVALAQASGKRGDGVNSGKGLEKTRSHLLKQLAHGKGGMSSWAALSLGVLGHSLGESREYVSDDVTRALRHQLMKTKDLEEATACVLALGVLRDMESGEAVLAKFEQVEDPVFRAYASLTLGLLSEREAREHLRAALDEAQEGTRADLLLEVAVGLRLLGDPEIIDELVKQMQTAETPEERTAVATVLGMIGDARAVGALTKMLDDKEEEASVRTAAAMSLGGLCDKQRIAFNVDYSADVQYQVLTWTLKSPFGDGTGILDMR